MGFSSGWLDGCITLCSDTAINPCQTKKGHFFIQRVVKEHCMKQSGAPGLSCAVDCSAPGFKNTKAPHSSARIQW